ncbi:glutamate 5-kinase [Mesorhizobium sp. M2A.F.Ca.ET.040.01.1.1]|nr:glutamate 5-kinase [Mesorhizobium sp. M2A.F.Ca.ET.040.01.1.1]
MCASGSEEIKRLKKNSPFGSARRLIVKIGSALIVDAETGAIRAQWLETLIEDVVRFFARGQQVIIVTSGAVAVGSRCFNPQRPMRIAEKQTAAAIGQVQLMLAYEEALRRHGFGIGQVLLTRQDLERGQGRVNLWAALQKLLETGTVPVINENDATATGEICFGDNDQLAARVAQMAGADLLILLSNVDGLFTEDPRRNPSARLIAKVGCITPEIELMASSSADHHSSGGMVTKLMAARIAMDAGCSMIIANGTKFHPLAAIENGGRWTRFVPLA